MVKKLLSLEEISEYYDTYYFDQWGVVHDGINIFKEAEQVFSYLQSQNKKIYISAGDGIGFNTDGLEWCDVYAKVNIREDLIPEEYSNKILYS